MSRNLVLIASVVAVLALMAPMTAAQEMIRVADEVRVSFTSDAFDGANIADVAKSRHGRLVWSQELHMPEASFITPHFSHFDLPKGAKVVVRAPDDSRSWTFTGYGKADSYMEDGFWGIHIYGPTAIVELYSKVPVQKGAVLIDAFTHGYPDLQWPDAADKAGGPSVDDFSTDPFWLRAMGGQKAICASDDSEWAKCYQSSEPTIYSESRAVARLLINGSGACTGWLVGTDG
ncbi:MAG: hypothetical protein AAGF23_09840, partial [Acidobacteriota bacterium]